MQKTKAPVNSGRKPKPIPSKYLKPIISPKMKAIRKFENDEVKIIIGECGDGYYLKVTMKDAEETYIQDYDTISGASYMAFDLLCQMSRTKKWIKRNWK